MVRNPYIRSFSTPQPSRSRYPEAVWRLSLTDAHEHRPFDSWGLQDRLCTQCGSRGRLIERVAFREGRAGEWYRLCIACGNIHFPPQPGTPPDLAAAIENARRESELQKLTGSSRSVGRPRSAPTTSGRRQGPVRGARRARGSLTPGPSGSSSVPGSGTVPFTPSSGCSSPEDPFVQVAQDEALARALQARFDEEAKTLVTHAPPSAANTLTKPRTFLEMAQELLAMTQGFDFAEDASGGSSQVANTKSPSSQSSRLPETAVREQSESLLETPTPAPRKRRIEHYVPPLVLMPPARPSAFPGAEPAMSGAPVPSSCVTGIQLPSEVIDISSDSSSEEDGSAAKPADHSRESSVISITDSEDERDVCPRKPFVRRVAITPSDVIEISDSEESDAGSTASKKENIGSSGDDVSSSKQSLPGLLASRSATCLTDLVASDSCPSDHTDDDCAVQPTEAAPVADGLTVPYVVRADADWLPFGDIFWFEIYPSLANLADGPFPVFKQATKWMLRVVIWDSNDLAPANKMITLDQPRCEIVLARYHIVRRVFDYTQVYKFRIWNLATTDWQHVSQTYGTCTMVERRSQKGKERATD
ncbi:hypothetical protein BD310DRAFT_982184 [Dichomitus squalens]|uniref:Uncharacterized protein n=1 Tax=Dichomitus squalens TaxID=114155 RepID=A0A4Q9PBQ8_9APHY|nr:hypothetical protein BD310DRAFT_982184 [Dichomitus squalens]